MVCTVLCWTGMHSAPEPVELLADRLRDELGVDLSFLIVSL